MKKKLFYGFLILEALVCLFCFPNENENIFAFLNFPFLALSNMLRTLSLSGTTGNIIAWIIYIAVCIIPLIILIYNYHKKRVHHVEDLLLVLISILLFICLYFLINQNEIIHTLGYLQIDMGILHLCSSVYVFIVSYLVLHIIHTFPLADKNKLFYFLKIALAASIILFVFIICTSLHQNNISTSTQDNMPLDIYASNLLPIQHSNINQIFSLLNKVIQIIPYAACILIAFKVMHLLDELKKDRYSTQVLKDFHSISSISMKSLTTFIWLNITFHLLQLIFANQINNIVSTISFPVMPIFFILIALLLTQFTKENKALKEDNDLFI